MSHRLQLAAFSLLGLFVSAVGCGKGGEGLFASGGAGPSSSSVGGAGGTSTIDAVGGGATTISNGGGGASTISNGGGGGSTMANGGGGASTTSNGGGGGGPFCGDGVRQPGERCDGNDVGMHDCTEFGFVKPGGLGCSPDCSMLDQSGCKAVCGNGTVEPGEQCDDSNTSNGDGCSSTCQTEMEPGGSCGTAIPINVTLGTATVAGSTDAGGMHSAMSCAADGPDIVYALTIAHDGFLTASLPRAVTSFDSVLYASKACDDAAEITDLTCNDSYDMQGGTALDGGEFVSFRVSAGETYFLFVDGFRPTDHGMYTLAINLATGVDCNSPVLIPLASGAPQNALGSTPGMPMVDQGTCGGGPGNEVIYAVSLDTPGALQVDTQNITYNAALYARAACSMTALQLDCSNNLGNGANESITATNMAATGAIFVWVDGSQLGGGQASGSYELVLTPP